MNDVSGFSDSLAFKPREYQLEMFRESMKHNIIVAMDTGSGKTAIAILRIREELELNRAPGPIWFLCPTVTLCEQQLRAIQLHLPSYACRLLCGSDNIDAWKTKSIWENALLNIRVVVCTHQILLDGLNHGFLDLKDIPLLIFDEAHHCTKNHPSNRIMNNFYHRLKKEQGEAIPTRVLGLTASPVVRSGVGSLKIVEQNLHSIARTPILHREQLLRHVHKPEIQSVFFMNQPVSKPPLLLNLMSIYQDKFVDTDEVCQDAEDLSLCSTSEIQAMTNDKLRKSVKRFLNTALTINDDLGPWMSEFYISSCARRSAKKSSNMQSMDLTGNEQAALSSLFSPLNVKISWVEHGFHASKLTTLVDIMVREMKSDTTGIVFVKTRTETYLLARFLSWHPRTRDIVRPGTCVGTSNGLAKPSGISELVSSKDQDRTLQLFSAGKINLLIATSVCDEGLDFRECNLVVCFELPPNLKSFIQRRGRARQEKSRFVLVVPDGEWERLEKWQRLEKSMIELYMDDLRRLENLENLECEEEESKEFVVESTGSVTELRKRARLSYDDAVAYLQHFCDKLPRTAHTQVSPIFTFESTEDLFTCSVLLPLNVDFSVREFSSARAWKTQKTARKDAAFEACIGLHEAGLLNQHLLPSPVTDSDVARQYEEIARRPQFALVEGQRDIWRSLASKWNYSVRLHYFHVQITEYVNNSMMEMIMVAPSSINHPSKTCLYPGTGMECSLLISPGPKLEGNRSTVKDFNKITRTILASIFGARMEPKKLGFPLLFIPKHLDDTQAWLSQNRGVLPASQLDQEDCSKYGLVRRLDYHSKRYSFLDLEPTHDIEEFPSGLRVKCGRAPKRTNFLVPLSTSNLKASERVEYIDSQLCEVDRLSKDFVRFARFVPTIMHRVGNFALAEELCRTILAPVGLSDSESVLLAISTPLAEPHINYQRLEFLGDAILKTLTAIALISTHLNWHEGYLTTRKDMIVSNARLSKAAEDTGLVGYILTIAFTGVKWRPLYVDEILSNSASAEREISTKVLADVVEALVGASYCEGGIDKALKALQVFIPEIVWTSKEQNVKRLQQAASFPSFDPNSVPQLKEIETILQYNFNNRALLLEAITHSSHMSQSLSVGSYERLEFLGDALLDYIVTTKIFQHPTPLPVSYMHRLRTAVVNGPFLAFCALSATTSVSIAAPNSDLIQLEEYYEPSSSVTEMITSLPIFLRHAPHRDFVTALTNARQRFSDLAPAISHALTSPTEPYPWRLLAAFKPEKVYSDIVESTLAAVWIDSSGDFGACEQVLRSLGVLTWLENALADQRKVWHPKEEVGAVAAGAKITYQTWKKGQTPRHAEEPIPIEFEDTKNNDYQSEEESEEDISDEEDSEVPQIGRGKWRCKIFVAEEEVVEVQGWNRIEVETAAAEQAIAILNKE